jgi:hypothetical protein
MKVATAVAAVLAFEVVNDSVSLQADVMLKH